MNALTEAVVEWVQGERIPQTRWQVIQGIVLLSRHCQSWPMATADQWGEAIDATCKEGLLVESDGVLRLATAMEPEQTESKQLELF